MSDFPGGIALSKGISGEPFSQIDCELLSTLSKQLAINIQNAKSFEIIKHLNIDLRNKNRTLEETLEKIQHALWIRCCSPEIPSIAHPPDLPFYGEF